MKVPYLHLKKDNNSYKEFFHNALDTILEESSYLLGDQLTNFENEFAEYIGCTNAIGVSNGLDGLELILKAAGIGEGDEVIVPSNTYIATWIAILNVGAKPVPVEPKLNTLLIDPSLIKSSITSKTKAIMVVHLYGLSCEMDTINKVAKENNLLVFEDCAQSHGATYKGIKTGALSDASSFSCYPTKNIGALGDAGVITTSNPEIYINAKDLRNYGSQKKYFNRLIGKNCRLDEIQAAFLRLKLKDIDNNNYKRDINASIYNTRLSFLQDKIKLPNDFNENYKHVWHIFIILTEKRNQLHEFLKNKGVETIFHYPIAPHKQECFKDSEISKMKLPISEKIHKECISLPMSPLHTSQEINYVCDCIIEFFSGL